jgi:Flp pilus assembly CpaF family ATPase
MFEIDYQLVLAFRDDVVGRVRDANMPAALLEASDEERSREVAAIVVREHAEGLVNSGSDLLPADDQEALVEAIIAEMYGLGRLQVLLDNPDIENINVNGCDRVWVTYASGEKRCEAPIAESDEDLVRMIQMIAHRKGRSEQQFDPAHPELDLRLPDGSRLSAVMAVSHRPVMSIRRHRIPEATLDDLVGLGMLDARAARLLFASVRARRNIMVAGPVGAGKTTMLRALAACIPPYERIVTVEQSFELGFHEQPHIYPDAVGLESREPNMEGEGGVGMRALVRRTKRMDANRVIVGEVLGDEVIDMLTAMLQGRSGSMCTIHSDSAYRTFAQIANYAVMSPERLVTGQSTALAAQALDFVVYVSLIDESSTDAGSHEDFAAFTARRFARLVTDIVEVVGEENGQVRVNSIYAPSPATGMPTFTGTPLTPSMMDKLAPYGVTPSLLASEEDVLEEGAA